MVELIRSSLFDGWLSGLGDRRAKVRIAARLDRLAVGNPGDVKPVGGDKSTQDADIKQAKALADHWKD